MTLTMLFNSFVVNKVAWEFWFEIKLLLSDEEKLLLYSFFFFPLKFDIKRVVIILLFLNFFDMPSFNAIKEMFLDFVTLLEC